MIIMRQEPVWDGNAKVETRNAETGGKQTSERGTLNAEREIRNELSQTGNRHSLLGASEGDYAGVSGGHPSQAGTVFEETGHPILLPGNPQAGSSVMVANRGAEKSAYSVNHIAGRRKGRKVAIREFDL